MKFQRIEILMTGDNSYTAVVDGLFADHLIKDEALAVVAAALFSDHSLPPFVRSYESWDWWQRRYSPHDYTPPDERLLLTNKFSQ